MGALAISLPPPAQRLRYPLRNVLWDPPRCISIPLHKSIVCRRRSSLHFFFFESQRIGKNIVSTANYLLGKAFQTLNKTTPASSPPRGSPGLPVPSQAGHPSGPPPPAGAQTPPCSFCENNMKKKQTQKAHSLMHATSRHCQPGQVRLWPPADTAPSKRSV